MPRLGLSQRLLALDAAAASDALDRLDIGDRVAAGLVAVSTPRRIADSLGGGGVAADVVKVTVCARDRGVREAVNREWLTMFSGEHSRPARHTIVYEHLPDAMLVQCEATSPQWLRRARDAAIVDEHVDPPETLERLVEVTIATMSRVLKALDLTVTSTRWR